MHAGSPGGSEPSLTQHYLLGNWLAGEASSLAINYTGTDDFRAAGYEPILASSAQDGASGLVRQHGNLSFSRVFQAGHEVPSYQPEAALAIFNRALGNLDIATGTKDTAGGGYSSVGIADARAVRNEMPAQELAWCYVRTPFVCSEEQIAAIENGSARIVHDVFEDANSTQLFPELFAKGGETSSTR